jgi:hypothetical protein
MPPEVYILGVPSSLDRSQIVEQIVNTLCSQRVAGLCVVVQIEDQCSLATWWATMIDVTATREFRQGSLAGRGGERGAVCRFGQSLRLT